MIHEKKQGAEDAQAQLLKSWGFMNYFSHVFFGICQIKKYYQRKSGTLKHAIVNNNRF